MMLNAKLLITTLLAFLALSTFGFAPQKYSDNLNRMKHFNANSFHSKNAIIIKDQQYLHTAVEKQRRSMTSVQTMSLFGLGGPEIVVILIAVFFLLGPQKLAELGRDAGRAASDFKDVPKEFQKGLEEGEIEARSRGAKPMEDVDSESK
mmetsp:Transcript_8427/g.12658  ORF Transcript_8427/g.12658 Transcript_8427/m.12658 type:complete len:149 (+) Transcript_8427:102-548(+)